MRKVVVVGFLLVTLLSAVFASAATLRVDGGTIQVFTFSVEVPQDHRPARRLATQTPTPTMAQSATPTWDGSRLEFTAAGFFCEASYHLFVEITNNGKAMQGPSDWRLLLGDSEITGDVLPVLQADEVTRLEFLAKDAGSYRFLIFQRPGFSGKLEVYSLEIAVGPEQCPRQPPVAPATSTPTPTLSPRPTQENTAEPLPTETLLPTEAPLPTETPTPAPTLTPTLEPTIEVITVEPPTETPLPEPSEPTLVPTAPPAES